MMEMAKVTSKGQITIPISIRRRLGINEGDKILFINKYDGVMMVNPDTVQGDVSDYAADSVPLDAVMPVPSAVPAPSAPPPAAAKPAAASAIPVSSYAAAPGDTPAAAPAPAPRRKYIPPVEEDIAAKPAAQAGGIDLSTLLDDIRSIGSNI